MIRSSALSHVGRKRDRNEDGVLERPECGLFLVADGVGGCRSGEVASAAAVRVFSEAATPDASGAEVWLRSSFAAAGAEVTRLSAECAELEGMATTCTVLLLREGWYHVLHVGDTRVYLLRDGKLSQITTDHTVVQVLVDLGELEPEAASGHPMRNQLTRVLGQSEVQPDYHTGRVETGDLWLLCSDGLSGVVPEAEWQTVLRRTELSLGERTALLIDAANACGGPDNITVVTVEVLAVPPTAPQDMTGPHVAGRVPIPRPSREAHRGSWLRRLLTPRRGRKEI